MNDRLAVIQYIKYELAVDRSNPSKPYAFFKEEPPGQPLYIGRPPAVSLPMLDRARQVWEDAKCWECHGRTGKGDGEKAAGLKDDLGFPIRPADLTAGQFKSGPEVEDMFRTMTTGLTGTPMPSYRDSSPEEDRWALSYYVLALSAFKDPLTGSRCRSPRPIARRSMIRTSKRARRRRPTFLRRGAAQRAAAPGAVVTERGGAAAKENPR